MELRSDSGLKHRGSTNLWERWADAAVIGLRQLAGRCLTWPCLLLRCPSVRASVGGRARRAIARVTGLTTPVRGPRPRAPGRPAMKTASRPSAAAVARSYYRPRDGWVTLCTSIRAAERKATELSCRRLQQIARNIVISITTVRNPDYSPLDVFLRIRIPPQLLVLKPETRWFSTVNLPPVCLHRKDRL